MKKTHKIAMWIAIGVSLIPAAYFTYMIGWTFIYVPIHAHNTRKMLNQVDHARLLSACRDMMISRQFYTNDGIKDITLSRGQIKIGRNQIQENEHFPQIIRDMNPVNIYLSSNQTIASLQGPPRMYFIAYAEGASEGGTRRLIPGLWFFNGKWRDERDSGQQSGGAVRLTRDTPIAEPIVAPEFGAPHR